MKYWIAVASATLVFTFAWLAFDARNARKDVERARLERDALAVRVLDLQNRIDEQNEVNRRRDLILHEELIQPTLPPPPHNSDDDIPIEQAMLDWYDAGQPKMTSWGEFYRQLRRSQASQARLRMDEEDWLDLQRREEAYKKTHDGGLN